MKRNSWIWGVGILAIIFGVLGLFVSAVTVAAPGFYKSHMALFSETESDRRSTPEQKKSFEEGKAYVMDFWGQPPSWFRPGFITMGVLGFLIYIFYLYGSIQFLISAGVKSRPLLTALTLSIVLNIIGIFVFPLAFPHRPFFPVASPKGWTLIFDFVLLPAGGKPARGNA